MCSRIQEGQSCHPDRMSIAFPDYWCCMTTKVQYHIHQIRDQKAVVGVDCYWIQHCHREVTGPMIFEGMEVEWMLVSFLQDNIPFHLERHLWNQDNCSIGRLSCSVPISNWDFLAIETSGSLSSCPLKHGVEHEPILHGLEMLTSKICNISCTVVQWNGAFVFLSNVCNWAEVYIDGQF